MDRRLKSAIFVFSVFVFLPKGALAQLKDNLELNLFGGGSVYSEKKFEIGFPQSTLPVQGAFKLSKEGDCASAFVRVVIGAKNFFIAMNQAPHTLSGVQHPRTP